MSPRARLEAAARELEPDRQGLLDGLCGIYATINGIRVALYPDRRLKLSERRWLFITGIDVLQRSRLLGWVVHDGMSRAMLRKVSGAIVAEAGAMLGLELQLVRAIGEEAGTHWLSLKAMRRHMQAGHPLLVTLWGPYNHTTVLVGYSRTRLQLFDSYGFRHIDTRSVAVAEGDTGRHRIHPADVVAIIKPG